MNDSLIITLVIYFLFLTLAIYCAIKLLIRRFGKTKTSEAKVLYKSNNHTTQYNFALHRPSTQVNYLVAVEIDGKKKKFVTNQGVFDKVNSNDIIKIVYSGNRIYDFRKMQ